MFSLSEDWTEGLHLKLANGQQWCLVAAESLRPWLEKFGSVMQLQRREVNGLPKLIFTDSLVDRTPGNEVATDVLLTGWTSRSLGAMRLWTHPAVQDVVCEMESDPFHGVDVLRMWFSVDIVHSNAVRLGALPLHAGLLEHNGRVVLLAGPGGAGKSTCCRRIPRPWTSPCDDEVLVVADHAGEFRCHPFPTWSDYLWGRPARTWDVQKHYPIKGIVFLKQAEKDQIRPVGRGEAAMLINGSATQVIFRQLRGLPQKDVGALKRRVFENSCNMAQKIPAFILSAARDGNFWVEIEKTLDL